ncbi:MAG TPA: ABC transporter permease [Thermoanaerobaculia bacterium]|nr:ABC transporter permease [Thermoanaerobaculia bacterium]
MPTLLQDLRFAFRTLRRRLGFATLCVLCLTLGIGVVVAVFSIVQSVLLRPLPYSEPERLVRVWDQLLRMDLPRLNASSPELFDYRGLTGVFAGVAAYVGPVEIGLTGDGEPERVRAAVVSTNLLPLLGARTIQGRTFLLKEGEPGKEDVVILGYDLWHRRFGGDPGVVGQRVMLDEQSHEIVGILPSGFRFPEGEADLFAALPLDPHAARDQRNLRLIGRLQPGVSLVNAQARMNAFARDLQRRHPDIYPPDAGWGIELISLQGEIVREVRPALLFFFGAVGLILLITCANVAGLLLAQALSRDGEMAVRLALGAGRGRIVRQLLTESVLLSLAAGALGLMLAFWMVPLTLTLDPGRIPAVREVRVDGVVVLFAIGVCALTSLLFGLVPALQSARPNLTEGLKQGLPAAGERGRRRFLRNALVVVEVALALVLLVGVELLSESFKGVQGVDPGFRPERLLTVRISLPPRYREGHLRTDFFHQAEERLSALPGVEAAGAISSLPLASVGNTVGFEIEGRQPTPGEGLAGAEHRVVTPGYHEVMGIPLLRGRYFESGDHDTAPRVVLVDEELARRYWPRASPVGARLRLGGEEDSLYEVVGVVRGVRHHGLDNEVRGTIYQVHPQDPVRSMALVVRTRSAPEESAAAVRAAIKEMDPLLSLGEMQTVEDLVGRSLAPRRLALWLLGPFSALAALLAALGIYGLLAHSVRRRRGEIGIRMALGAGRNTVMWLLVGNGLRLCLVGTALGLATAMLASSLLARFLFQVSPLQPTAYLLASALMIAVGAGASLGPAWKASRTDPAVVLRSN